MLDLDRLTLRRGAFSLRADWRIAPGSRLALLGPSGAGKSTLLDAIAGFLPPASGRILWESRDLTPLPPGRRPVSLLFQSHNLFPHLSVRDNVALGLDPGLKLPREAWERIDAALDRVGLAGLGDRLPGALSGGQQQRAALARALIREKPLLLLDEPFAALGPALRAEMLDLVAAITEATGATLIMVTHAPEDAARIADLTSVVAGGTAAPPEGTALLLAAPPPALAAYLGRTS